MRFRVGWRDHHGASDPAFRNGMIDLVGADTGVLGSAPINLNIARGTFGGGGRHDNRSADACLGGEGRFGGHAAQDLRIGFGEGPRAQHRDFEIPVFAGMHDFFLGPALDQDFFYFLKPFLRAGGVDFVAAIFVGVDQAAAPEADDQAAFADIIDQRNLLGHAERVVERGLQDRKADFDPACRHRQGGGEGRRIDVNAIAVKMMFGEEHRVHPKVFGKLGFSDGLVDDLAVQRGITGFVKQKNANPHKHLLRCDEA